MKNTPHTPRLLLLTALGSALLAAAHAATPAAPASSEKAIVLDPFTVKSDSLEGYRSQSSASGLGFTLPIEKVPIPLVVLTPQFLADSGGVKVEDALRYVSGVTNTGRTSKEETYAIRGFSTANLLRDGEPFNNSTDRAILERVEVLKGPGAIIYGTADPSGLVNVVQKQAHFKTESVVEAMFAEYGSYHGMIDHNQAFGRSGDWHGAGRVILSRSREGFPRVNEFRDRTLAAGTARVEYGKDTVLEGRVNWSKEDGRINRIQTPFRNTGEGGSVFARGFVPILRDFTFVTPHDDWDHEDKGYSLRLVQHVGPDTTLLASFVNSEIDAVHYFNIGQGRIGANAQGEYIVGPARMVVEPRKTDHRGLSFKLLHTLKLGKSEHKISAGFRDNRDTNYGYAYFDSRVFANVATVVSDNAGPKAVTFPGAPRSVFSLNDPFATIITGVASATNPDPVDVRSAYLTDYATFFDGQLSLLAGGHHIDIRSQGKTATSPQFGAIWEFARGYNLYALSSNSYRPNGPASTVNAALGFLDPEKGSGREIGLKFNPAGSKLSGTAALYRITRENIVQFLGGVFTQNNNVPSGEEISKGLEVDLVYTPAPNLSIMAAYAYTDAYVSKNVITTDGNSPDENRDGVADIIGLPKEGVPEHDVRLWASYAFERNSPLRGLSFGGGYTWRKGPIQQFPTYIHRFIREESDPVRVDLFASYRTKVLGREAGFRLNWHNVTNADYRDRRGYFVQPSTLQFSAETRF